MILLSIFTALTIFFTIYIYFRTTNKSTRFDFNSISTLLQTVFVFITLWITIYTIRSSNSDTNKLFENLDKFNEQFIKMESSLDSVSNKLRTLPIQINKFSQSLDTLNSITNSQTIEFQKSTQSLNQTIEGLSKSVKDYERNIDNYSQQLNSIVKLTDKQLLIWEEQQRILLDEFSRKPILSIIPKQFERVGDTLEVNDINIVNDGNIEANIRSIYLILPEEGLIYFNSSQLKKYQTLKGKTVYRFMAVASNVEIVAAKVKIIIPCNFKILKQYTDWMEYRIDYFSKYDSGWQGDAFVIE